MPKRITPLSETKVRNIKPKTGSPQKLFDGGGLFLLVTPTGGKLWQFKYRFKEQDGNVKEKKLSFGTYPEISLADARQRREDARRLLANGVDPGAVKKARKEAQTAETETFEVIAREWHTRFTPQWSDSHTKTTLSRLEHDLFPWLGSRPIRDIKCLSVNNSLLFQ